MKQPSIPVAHNAGPAIFQPARTLKIGHSHRIRSGRWGLVIGLALLATVIGAGTVWSFNVFQFKNQAIGSFGFMYSRIADSIDAIKNFHPGEANRSLTEAKDELASVRQKADKYGLLKLSDMLGAVIPLAGEIPKGLNNLQNLFQASVDLTAKIEELKLSGISYVFKDGGRLILLLDGIKKNSKSIADASASLFGLSHELKNTALVGGYLSDINIGDNLSLITDLNDTQDFLGATLDLLNKSGGFHLALFFQNLSEMRPSGGFIGSYADLEIKNGQVQNIDVRDIYDPDGQLDAKTIPPLPLQAITKNWGARDANWFFDFPTSAEKVLSFLDRSKIYSEKNIKFEGAIALNTTIIEDILNITGPILLPDYKLTIDKDNFLEEVQKEVEAGHSKALGEPKRILKDLAPLLLEKLKNLDDNRKEALIKQWGVWSDKKDVQIYFRGGKLESFAVKSGLGGEVYKLPENFMGNYLAVVNANIAGGKTDIFIDQSIQLKTTVDLEGQIKNELEIVRQHTGDKEKYSWYRAPNQDYVRILAPKDSSPGDISGNTVKTVWPYAYDKKIYQADPDVVLLEKNGEESGKTVFGAWITTEAGTTRTIKFSYQNPYQIEIKKGGKYQFIFDRQSGVKGGVEFNVVAPGGYKWMESDSTTYVYKNDNPDKRIVFELTLAEL